MTDDQVNDITDRLDAIDAHLALIVERPHLTAGAVCPIERLHGLGFIRAAT